LLSCGKEKHIFPRHTSSFLVGPEVIGFLSISLSLSLSLSISLCFSPSQSLSASLLFLKGQSGVKDNLFSSGASSIALTNDLLQTIRLSSEMGRFQVRIVELRPSVEFYSVSRTLTETTYFRKMLFFSLF
jgi:hypothetical protein